MYIQIAILIIVIIGAVHVVYEKGKKAGLEFGINKGRMEILVENIYRIELSQPAIDRKLIKAIENGS
jgi:thiamine transporter ThiT